jgi:6-phosphogluconolactonase (cycloisomerase 2 family)
MENVSITAMIDPCTGAFASVSASTSFLGNSGMAAVNGRFLYISVGSAILASSIDPTNGALTSLAGSPFAFPGRTIQGLAATPSGSFLYAADAAGGVDGFQVNGTTGALSLLSGSPFGSATENQIVISPSGDYLYATDYADGEVLAFAIGSTGPLTPIPGSPFSLPGGAGSNPLDIVDTGNFVYVAMSGSNQIAGFSANPATGALAVIPGSPFAAGDPLEDLAWSGSFLYAVADASIPGYRIDPASGALAQLAGSPFFADRSVGLIAIDPSGKYMFVSTSVGIDGADIDPSSGALTQNAAGGSIDGVLWLTVVQLPSSGSQ